MTYIIFTIWNIICAQNVYKRMHGDLKLVFRVCITKQTRPTLKINQKNIIDDNICYLCKNKLIDMFLIKKQLYVVFSHFIQNHT